MALSQTEIDLLYDTGKFVTQVKKGKELSSHDQEILSAGLKLFFFLIDELPSLSDYRGYDTYYQKNGLSEFIKFVNLSAFGVAAEEVAKVIAEEKKQKRIKQLHFDLVYLLQALYAENEKLSWMDIPSKYRVDFRELAFLEGLPSDFVAYQMIRTEAGLPPEGAEEAEKEKPELEGEPTETKEEKEEKKEIEEETKPEEAITQTLNNNQVIAANLAAYLADKEALDKLATTLTTGKEKDRALIRKMLEIVAIKKQREILLARADDQTKQAIASVNRNTSQKILPGQLTPLESITQTSQTLVELAVAQTNLQFTPEEITLAAELFSTASVAGLVDLEKPDSVSQAIEIALADTKTEYHTPTADAYRQIFQSITQTTQPDYETPEKFQITPELSLDQTKIKLPDIEIASEKPAFEFAATILDQAEALKKTAAGFSATILANPQTDLIMAKLTGAITPQQEAELTQILISQNLLLRVAPTAQGAKSASVIEQLNPTNNLILVPASIRLSSMGLEMDKVDRHLLEKPDSKLARFAKNNPGVLNQIRAGLYHLHKPENKLGADSAPPPHRPGPLADLTARYQTLTNKLSGLLPSQAAKVFNAVTHPLQFIQGKVGSFIGQQVAGKLKSFLLEQVGSKIANESLKHAAQFILEKGLKAGIEKVASFALAKIGATAAVAGISAALGISTGGVSLIIQAAVMAAMWIGEKTFGLVKNVANGLARAITGEDFDWKPIAAAPLLLLSGAGSILAGLGAATSIAAMSAGVAILISTIAGFFFYMIVITVAPVITTIAQLDSGLAPASAGTVEEFVPTAGIKCDATLPAENNTTSNAVARKAYEIVSKLNRGFWGYCNNHPDFPELFNSELFKADPNPPYPGPIQNSAANLFWCTQLTAKAYGYAPGNSYSADGQVNGVNFQAVEGLNYSAVQPGDIVFINVNKSSRVANHVGIVYSVTQDAIVYLQSNAATKTANIPVRTDGTIQSEIGRIAIIGFGRP